MAVQLGATRLYKVPEVWHGDLTSCKKAAGYVYCMNKYMGNCQN